MAQCLKMLKKPVTDEVRYGKVWQDKVLAMKDQYAMAK